MVSHSCLFNRVRAGRSFITVDIIRRTDIYCQNCGMVCCKIFYSGTVMCVDDVECLVLQIQSRCRKD